jgi:hypothetical protein
MTPLVALITPIAPATDLWDYLANTLPAGALINGLGLGALAILFATDRVLTKGQHLRRVADLTAANELALTVSEAARVRELAERDRFHNAILEEKDRAFAIVERSRDGYKEATALERARADRATEALSEFADLGRLATQLLRSLDEVQKGPSA